MNVKYILVFTICVMLPSDLYSKGQTKKILEEEVSENSKKGCEFDKSDGFNLVFLITVIYIVYKIFCIAK